MKTFLLSCVFACMASGAMAQGYQFTDEVKVPATPVKNQAATGTCWCFATTSFMESELLRMGKGEYDLSEMFIVRQKYINQMKDNYLRRGKGNVGQGSLSPSWMHAFEQVGIVPEEVYHGINYDSEMHNHQELASYVESISETAIKLRANSPEYQELVNSLFDIYLGKVPEKFTYQGKEYTPKSFATSLMYNLPLDEMIQTMDYALKNGYSIGWDGDVSEKGFSFINGVAINPEVNNVDTYAGTDRARFEKMNPNERLEEVYKFEHPYPEVNVTPEVRQKGYETFVTTDDHLMHITGITKDQNGTKYYITKNSWGTERNRFGGYLNMSESFVKAKTIYILVHKDAIPKEIKAKLGIQ